MPISEQQKEILLFPFEQYDVLIASGAVRAGKTSLMTVAFMDDAMRRYNGQLFGICGKTLKNAEKNVVNPWARMTRTRDLYQIKRLRSDNMIVVSRGDTRNYFELFGGKDERSQDLIQGRTLAGVLLNEAALMPESFVNQATARCSVDDSRIFMDCNPASPDHWLYQNWILRADELNAKVVNLTMRDNPSLSEKTLARYERTYKGVFYDRFVLGKWVIAEGLVYQFEQGQYVMPEREIEGVIEDTRGRWYISIDYGITNPFAALLVYVTNTDAYVVDEYYFDSKKESHQRTDSEHLDAVERLAGDRNISEVIIDPSATSFKVEMYRRGRFYYQNADNSVIDGIAFTNQCIADGHLKVSSKCKNLIKEFGMYRWNDKSDRDAVIKEFDHAADALRYVSYTVLADELKAYR